MHEMSTCQALIKQVEKAVQDYVNSEVVGIEVSIAQFSNINIQEFEELFPLASLNTIAEHAKLTVILIPSTLRCLDCKKDGATNTRDDNNNLVCPLCKSTNTIPLNGTDMLLSNVELEEVELEKVEIESAEIKSDS